MSVGRSNTGVYHNVMGNASRCNGRSFRGYALKDTAMIEKADEAMFCKKCFFECGGKTRKDHALHVFATDKQCGF